MKKKRQTRVTKVEVERQRETLLNHSSEAVAAPSDSIKSSAKWFGAIYQDTYGWGWIWEKGENKCLGRNKGWRECYPGLTQAE